MSTNKNILISASAGTGKTYQLSLRYLAILALNGGKNPERLIAITFTRKAAGEFKDRILTDLAKGASSDAEAATLKDRLWNVIKGTEHTPGLSPNKPESWRDEVLTRDYFVQMLKNLSQNLIRLNLCTIDSLFSQIASGNTYELGVSGFSMISDTEETLAKKEALLSLYREASLDPEKIREFEDIFLSGSTSESEAAYVGNSMLERLDKYHDLYLSAPNEQQWGNPVTLGFTKEELTPTLEPFDFTNLIDEKLKDWPSPADENKDERMFREFLEGLQNFIFNGKAGFENTVGKETLEQLKARFGSLWDDDVDLLVENWVKMSLAEQLRRTRATYRLMSIFEKKYAELIRDKGRFKFNDVTRILGREGISPELKKNLQYRMYCRYDHWMLDEFQDTSQSQWQVIRPFLEELACNTDADGSIFVVGDIKQSVYQWRGGDPDLFRNVSKQLNLTECGMATSFRSVQPVLEMVNDLCDYRIMTPTAEQTALIQWGEYPEHRCADRLTGKDGVAQIWQGPNVDQSEKNEYVFRTIEDILNQTGALNRGWSVAVLTDTNAHAMTIRTWLTEHGIPAEVSDDVQVGVDSPLGKDLIHFFNWLLTPGNAYSAGFLKSSPLKCLISKDTPDGLDWADWHLILEKDGYSAVMTEVARRLRRNVKTLTDYQNNRLEVWLNEAAQMDKKGLPPEEWTVYMEELKRREEPAGNVVKVMTVHKSKGLGFDIVILPQIGNDNPFANATHLQYLVKKTADGQVDGIILKPDKKIIHSVNQIGNLYHKWMSTQQFDGFCKLYVALTRAKRANYVIYPQLKSEDPQKVSMWSLLRRLPGKRPLSEPMKSLPKSGSTCVYSTGDPLWYEKDADHPLTEENVTRKDTEQHLTWPAIKPLYRERVSPSGLDEAQQASQPAAQNIAAMQYAAEFGTKAHALFECITRLDAPNLPDWIQNPATDVEKAVAECLQCPDIKALFLPPTGTVIMKEQRIEAIDGDKWISGIIDRLHLMGDHALIIDYKTDRTDSPDELRARHSKQLQAYARIVSRITGIPTENIACVLVSTYMKRIVEL